MVHLVKLIVANKPWMVLHQNFISHCLFVLFVFLVYKAAKNSEVFWHMAGNHLCLVVKFSLVWHTNGTDFL